MPRILLTALFILLLCFPAKAELAQEKLAQEKLVVDWQLYQNSPEFFTGATAESFLLVLNLTLADSDDEPYLYAPFAINSEQHLAETAPADEAYLPTAVTVRVSPSALVFFPPGTLKYDPFSDAKLPVYHSRVSLIVPLPADYLNQSLSVLIEALVCSSKSCSPFRKQIELLLTDASLQLEPLPGQIKNNLATYKSFAPAEQKNTLFRLPEADVAEHSNLADLANSTDLADLSGSLAALDYTQTFTPQFFNAGLEVSGPVKAIALGLLAGFILNFMPCVLPVVTLKLGTLAGLGGVSGLSGQSMQSDSEYARRIRKRLRTYSLFFSLGVFVWFAALFAIIGLAGMMWGQMFQSEKLLLGLTIILFLMSLSLLGVFRLPLLHVEYGNTNTKSLPRQAFLGGLLSTLMATPCSGPLLGGVLSWAVGEPLPFLALALCSVGLGMAAPFLLLGFKPGLARFLPKPGSWTLALEKTMAFLLMGTVLYLLSMLQAETIIRILGALLLLSLAAWIWGQTVARRLIRGLSVALSAIIAALALNIAFM
ncbi:MAG: hypothetical protein LBV76_03155, partial [Deltaproteobacteria bacterium]|nr:hypothetical protein [Deltaproteobacteria bacterium]